MSGSFREDLFFRVNVIEIPVPPLREREGDLPLLAHSCLVKCSKELGKNVNKVSAYAMDILSNYSFPGNVRELENIIERSVALETSNIVLPQSLALSHFKQVQIKEDRRRTDIGHDGMELDTIMADIERGYILKAIEMAHGSKQGAANLLGITVDSLKYRLKKLNI